MKGALRDIGVSTAIGLGAFFYFMKQDDLIDVATSISSFSSEWWTCVFVLSWPYLLYVLIWNSPSTWMNMCSVFPLSLLGGRSGDKGKTGVSVFSKLVLLSKLPQLYSYGRWWISSAPSNISGFQDMFDFLMTHISTERLYVAALLLLVGQILNAGIYYRIGDDGVYYGFKMGRNVPWCTKFPFNVGLRHPQYVGVVLNIWAISIVLLTPFAIRGGLLQLSLAWCLMYFAVSCMEESGSESKKSKKK